MRHNPAAGQQVLAAWAAQNPDKAAEFQRMDELYRNGERMRAYVSHANEQQRQATFQHFARAEDDKFYQAHPELADPKAHRAAQEDTLVMLRERGLSEERIRQLWMTDSSFRSAEAQSLIYSALKPAAQDVVADAPIRQFSLAQASA